MPTDFDRWPISTDLDQLQHIATECDQCVTSKNDGYKDYRTEYITPPRASHPSFCGVAGGRSAEPEAQVWPGSRETEHCSQVLLLGKSSMDDAGLAARRAPRRPGRRRGGAENILSGIFMENMVGLVRSALVVL